MIPRVQNKVIQTIWEYFLISFAMLLMTVGVYFFKFPNHFAFGGVTGYSSVISALLPISAGDFTFAANTVLLVIGFLCIGRRFGLKTVYASLLMSAYLSLFEKLFPLEGTLTGQPVLELIYAILLPAVGSALLFEIDASSGGTDIIAMVVKKFTKVHIGKALLIVDVLSVTLAFIVFGPETGLFSVTGLLVKSFLLDSFIESIRLCKCFTIICSDPEPINRFILEELHRGATVYDAKGAYTEHHQTVILTTMSRRQAIRLKNFIHDSAPDAFMLITNSSEIIGKGFLSV